MATGSISDFVNKAESVRGRAEVGSAEPKVGAFVPRRDHNPRELKSWAKRTGFVSNFSGETVGSSSGKNESGGGGFDLERGFRGGSGSSPKFEIDPVLGRTRPTGEAEIEPAGNGGVRSESEEAMRVESRRRRSEDDPVLGRDEERSVGNEGNENRNNGNGAIAVASAGEAKKMDQGEEMHLYPDGEEEPVHGGWGRPSAMRIGLRENLGFVPLIYYGLQHYLSLAGSLIFIPLIIVPTMGGTDKDTATVISTMLLVSGITTILHTYFGTRLPLVQGSSFVYLAPALVIMNAQEYRNLTEHKFRHIMRELQGAIIIGSIFQSILGFTGLMSLLLRLINPIVVAPTVAAVGLAFFSYGFPQAGSCVEISIPQILLVLMFTLYLRGVNIFGHRLFRIYAVPLSIMIIWTYAFFLTAGGAYDYKGCTSDIPSSNILIDACRRHAYTMQHCRTDVSNAWRTAAWVRIPYPLQWGIPIFHFRTSIIMVFVSLVASVDSVGTYHSASMQINLKPPTRGIVSRGIALEGFCSILAGLWGSGTGSTTLTENVHTINITKVASRRVVELGAVFLIFFSFIGKVGAILASIPLALAASVLCFTWALVVALGLSTLQYSRAASFRNMMIVGVSLFLGLSIPAYFQQYQPESTFILPSYFIPYAAASNGPARTGSKQLDFAINALMSLNMVVTLVVALVLENTVPGSRQERGVYIWSKPEDINTDPSSLEDYSLPRKVSRCLCRSNCLGV
ncbi:putative xanthine/uracil/vitamin C permease [Rosa chinensis]|uniref:Putative xanthine/uracil/vitamin C permease n=1 Tax=Rosa chinensis TaxID=74649 RepID=A0A2P6RPX0_ROSCH|nr:nucleobase-ascorbate transporter 11 isoform X1 [Rosa chinensis]PRQ48473.1 putative xanthine/uracil/vitamin C permease [Rosa chinensis]